MELRTAICRGTDFQTRAENGELYIEGYFAVFGGVYEMWDGAVETIDRHAFDKTLGNDIRALTNHNSTLVLGRTSAGTLELRLDDRGLWGRIKINQQDSDAMNLYSRVQRGDVSQCSFGFYIVRQEITDREDGVTEFRLLEIDLHEVSVVTFPAYKDTSVQARKDDLATIRAQKHAAWQSAMQKKLKGA